MSPRRSRLFAASVLVAQLFVIASRAADRGGEAPNLLAGLLFRAVAPILGAVDRVDDWATGWGRATRTRRELLAENRKLADELTELRRERLRAAGLEAEVETLARGLAFGRESRRALAAAEIVYFDRNARFGALVLRVGARGAEPGQAVVVEAGVVGRVIAARGGWAKVQLLTDRAAAVGVQLEGARRQGILHGGEPERLLLDYIPRQVEVEIGDRVSTAGIDGVYPRGLPVGAVVAVEPGSELFHRIWVRSSVDFDALSTVYLLDRIAFPTFSDGGRGDARVR